MVPVSLDCQFLIAPSISSNIYFSIVYKRKYKTLELTNLKDCEWEETCWSGVWTTFPSEAKYLSADYKNFTYENSNLASNNKQGARVTQ